MIIRTLLFANLKKLAGRDELEIEVPEGTDIREFKRILGKQEPHLKSALEHALTAINHQYAFDNDVIPEGADVALFPPVSGGSEGPTVCMVTDAPINMPLVVESLLGPDTGAVCTFTGVVRSRTTRGEAHETASLEYEAYIPMAEKKMQQVAREIRERWPDVGGVAIIQRIGHLLPETPTVIIACSSAHRDCGIFEATRYGIDRLKEIIPIWKKEIGPGGETWVEGEYQPQKGD